MEQFEQVRTKMSGFAPGKTMAGRLYLLSAGLMLMLISPPR